MKKITQAEFDALPVVDGLRQCPGMIDYSSVSIFGKRCRFGEGCRLEKTKRLIGNTIYTFGGFGRENRTTYMIPMKSGVYVRCGCWAGTLDQFRVRVTATHGDNDIAKEYLAICDVAQMRWKREINAHAGGEG